MDNEAAASNELAGTIDMGLAGIKMASALFIILAVIFLGFYLLKRFGYKAGFGMGTDSRLRIISTLGIGPKKSIVVVRFLNKDLVLGVTDTRINLLTESQVDEKSEREFSQILSKKTDLDST